MSWKKELFAPLNGKNVKIYVCGITPYDTTHLGHAFTYVNFDTLLRYLQFSGYRIDYTQNVTDIDDDILRKAKEKNMDWIELGEYWTNRFTADMNALNVMTPTHYVKATDAIQEIITMVQSLQKKGHAYEKNGTVYFDITSFPEYGKLSKYTPVQMLLLSKERGADPGDPDKKDPLDFILWQKGKEGEPSWESPWGKGRPGWHIECSAMINKYLGKQIDIHGGGHDLIYPHHESEIAQSESYTGVKPFVKYWMHTSMVQYGGEKMAKSLGNLIMVSDLIKQYSPNAIRWLLLSYHYRQPWEYGEEQMQNAQQKAATVESVISKADEHTSTDESASEEFRKFMDDDLNTPLVLEWLYNAAKNASMKPATMRKIWEVMGFR